jgi:uncharacterized membrane protein
MLFNILEKLVSCGFYQISSPVNHDYVHNKSKVPFRQNKHFQFLIRNYLRIASWMMNAVLKLLIIFEAICPYIFEVICPCSNLSIHCMYVIVGSFWEEM